ncbi:hypothetical protein CRG98_020536 [Punica granatum]|uniref:Uncharacterized protein n=1 Tax=Punica granatum TaxID=22663 RepID=A0A2I0JS63_PUNGR|nr:hypothetical protein CRG98_020536 [Punica granatum]
MREGRNWNAPGELSVMSCEAVKMLVAACLNDLMAGGAKAESPPIPTFLHLKKVKDSLCMCSKTGSRDVVAPQQNFPYHAIGSRWTHFSVVLDRGDGIKRVEREILVFADANIGDLCLLVDRVVLFAVGSDEFAFDKGQQPLM